MTGVLDRELTVGDVVALHADALDAQIRILRLRRAVLRAAAKRSTTLETIKLMHNLAKMSEEERNRILSDFYDEVFGGRDPEFEERMRSVRAELPDDPSPEQVEAWIEPAQLVQEPGFRQRVREMSEAHSAMRQAGEEIEASPGAAAALVPVVDALRGRRPAPPSCGRPRPSGSPWATTGGSRYWQLLGTVNGWDPFPSMTPAFTWSIEALRAHPRR